MAGFTRISTADIANGMIIVKIDKTGLEFPYYGTPIVNHERVRKYLEQNNCAHVYIRTPDGQGSADIEEVETDPLVRDLMESAPDIGEKPSEALAEFEFSLVGNTMSSMHEVRESYQKARDLAKNLLMAVKNGQQLEIRTAQAMVDDFVKRCEKNPSVFATLSRQKESDEAMHTHAVNVCVLAIILGKRMNMDNTSLNAIGLCGLLHDIGKMKLPERLWGRTDNLSPTEMKVVSKHPILGFEELQRLPIVPTATRFGVLHHHEHVDGTGYPSNLDARKISNFGKIIGLVNAYDNLTTDTRDSAALTPTVALKQLYKYSNRRHPAEMIKYLVAILGVYPAGTLVLLDTGEVAVVFEINRTDLTRPRVLLITNEEQQPLDGAEPFDLSTTNLTTKKPYKQIINALDPKDHNVDIPKIMSDYLTRLGAEKGSQ